MLSTDLDYHNSREFDPVFQGVAWNPAYSTWRNENSHLLGPERGVRLLQSPADQAEEFRNRTDITPTILLQFQPLSHPLLPLAYSKYKEIGPNQYPQWYFEGVLSLPNGYRIKHFARYHPRTPDAHPGRLPGYRQSVIISKPGGNEKNTAEYTLVDLKQCNPAEAQVLAQRLHTNDQGISFVPQQIWNEASGGKFIFGMDRPDLLRALLNSGHFDFMYSLREQGKYQRRYFFIRPPEKVQGDSLDDCGRFMNGVTDALSEKITVELHDRRPQYDLDKLVPDLSHQYRMIDREAGRDSTISSNLAYQSIVLCINCPAVGQYWGDKDSLIAHHALYRADPELAALVALFKLEHYTSSDRDRLEIWKVLEASDPDAALEYAHSLFMPPRNDPSEETGAKQTHALQALLHLDLGHLYFYTHWIVAHQNSFHPMVLDRAIQLKDDAVISHQTPFAVESKDAIGKYSLLSDVLYSYIYLSEENIRSECIAERNRILGETYLDAKSQYGQSADASSSKSFLYYKFFELMMLVGACDEHPEIRLYTLELLSKTKTPLTNAIAEMRTHDIDENVRDFARTIL